MTRDRIDELFDRAREDGPGPVDVTHRVMQRIAEEGAAPLRLVDDRTRRTVMVCAGLSLAAAGIVAALVLPLWLAYDDPLAGFMQAITAVAP